jgi:hypothetical protein
VKSEEQEVYTNNKMMVQNNESTKTSGTTTIHNHMLRRLYTNHKPGPYTQQDKMIRYIYTYTQFHDKEV